MHGKSVGIRIEFLYNEYEDMLMTNIVECFDAKEFVEEENLGMYLLMSFSIYESFMKTFSTLCILVNQNVIFQNMKFQIHFYNNSIRKEVFLCLFEISTTIPQQIPMYDFFIANKK